MKVENLMNDVMRKHPGEPEFHQAVREVLESIEEVYNQYPEFEKQSLAERMVEPERVFIFRVPWVDDKGNVQVNIGYRVQFNNAIGPYKGGLRFHSSVNLGILKFLGFEQTFKNALTTLPMGGAKGGSDFHPRGKSNAEVMRFCQSFMTELWRVIGPDTDVPAGDIGVGAREIGFMYGMYRKLARENTGTFTGKGIDYGGSLMRPEATGYGNMYFLAEMLRTKKIDIKGKTVVISGSGNVAQFTAKKCLEWGAKVVTLSDSDGYIFDPEGLDAEKLAFVFELKNVFRGRIKEYADKYKVQFVPKTEGRVWSVPCDIALPSATQNELNGEDAKILIENGCIAVSEGANMPSTPEAIQVFQDAKILYAPGKAANAGGVATSGLEMSQNSMRYSWSAEEVDAKLQSIMKNIHENCVKHGTEADGYVNYVKGANIAGFLKVARAMMAQGIV